MKNSKNRKIWMPAIIGVAIFIFGVLTILICNNLSTCNSTSCVYGFVEYIIPMVCLEFIVPYGISLAMSGGAYYLFDKFILSKKNRTGKDHPFLWSLLLSIILFYPAHELVDYAMCLILFK